jgi:chromosome segregation ATPase
MSLKKPFEIILILLCFSLTFCFLYFAIEKVMPGPCDKPIKYSIGDLDPRFGISRDELLTDIKMAEASWESASGRNLFDYSPEGAMKINLIYDYRQEATEKISSINATIENGNASYQQVKADYDQLSLQYDSTRKNIDSLTASYSEDLSAYNKKVADWNSGDHSSAQKYANLEAEKKELESRLKQINSLNDQANSLVEDLNAKARQLNSLSRNLNSSINNYNQTNESIDAEFEEGEFSYENGQKVINIYQFESRDKLIRVLEHELGHSLGLDHTASPEDIMYGLNVGSGQTLTQDDLAELDRACSQKPTLAFMDEIKKALGLK